jgi:hypothetical protein
MKYVLFTLLILLNSFCSVTAQNNNESVKHEKIYLHTDKYIYKAGDNLFFTLYLKGSLSQMSKYAYLILRDRYNFPVTRARIEIKNQSSFGNISLPDTLHSDIYQLVCYTNRMRNEGEVSYFTKEIIIANRFDKKLERFDSTLYTYPSANFANSDSVNETGNENLFIHPDKKIYNTREKVNFSIDAKNIQDDSIIKLSVSVSEIVPGRLTEPSVSDYFNNTDNKIVEGESEQYQYKYQPEIKGTIIDGRIMPVRHSGTQPVSSNTNNESDIINYTVLVSTPDSIANMQYTSADSSGSFRFLLNPYYEGKELIIRLKENAKAVIELDDKFKLFQPYVPSDFLNGPGIRSYLIRNLNISEVQRYYTEKAETNTGEKIEYSLAIPRVYYKPYTKVFPSDYLPLPDFVEISRELLPALKVRKINDNYVSSYIDTQNKGVPSIEPIIFLDGVPVNDVNQIINLGSDQIKHIDMLPVIRYYGEMSLSGILAVFTKNLEINNIQFTTPAVRYQAISSQTFTKPTHYIPVNNNNHIPDLRQVLIWDPEIKIHNKEKLQIECYTSDLHGKYRISVQGITSKGLPVNGSAIITVKSKSD